jgi:hypothetical protein
VEIILAAHGLQVPKRIVAAPLPPKARVVPGSLSGLSAAIASLSGASLTGLPTSNRDSNGAGSDNCWEDVLRYVHFLEGSVQVNERVSWERVRLGTEQLRDQFRGKASQASSSSADAEAARALQEIQASRDGIACELQKREQQLHEAAENALKLHQGNEHQLGQIAVERGERGSGRRRNEGHGDTCANDLLLHETRMQTTAREVENLWGQLIQEKCLEPWQVEHVERLRREIAEARGAASSQQPMATRHDAGAEAQAVAVRNDGTVVGSLDAGTVGLDASDPQLESARFGSVVSNPPQWDIACRSVEQLRERFQLAAEQARQTIAAN